MEDTRDRRSTRQGLGAVECSLGPRFPSGSRGHVARRVRAVLDDLDSCGTSTTRRLRCARAAARGHGWGPGPRRGPIRSGLGVRARKRSACGEAEKEAAARTSASLASHCGPHARRSGSAPCPPQPLPPTPPRASLGRAGVALPSSAPSGNRREGPGVSASAEPRAGDAAPSPDALPARSRQRERSLLTCSQRVRRLGSESARDRHEAGQQ